MTNGHQPKGDNPPKSPPGNPPNQGSAAHHPTGAGLFPTRKASKGSSDAERTLRDDFAKEAMGHLIRRCVSAQDWANLPHTAYEIADAMLEARKR